MKGYLPATLIMLVSVIGWLFLWPTAVWETLTFQKLRGIKDVIMGIVLWCYLIGGAIGLTMLCSYL